MKNDKIIKKEVKLIKAKKEDSSEILKFVKDLAECEQILHEVTATKEDIEDGLFNNSNQKKTLVEVVFAQIDGQNVGFCLYFYNFPTFIGKPGIFIEDIYIKPEYRGYGIGKKFFSYIVKLAKDSKCERIEWMCLDWNQNAIGFYKSLGAKPLENWTTFRLDGDNLKNFDLNLDNN
jgi:GNAT superfamily N-acetyltransferase